MTMLKGYSIPQPGPTDGEYGGFGDVQFAGYAQSPADRPYWEGQGIARTIPALNGYGLPMPSQLNGYGSPPLPPPPPPVPPPVSVTGGPVGTSQFQSPAPGNGMLPPSIPMPALPIIVGAVLGRLLLGNLRGAAVGAVAGYFYNDSNPNFSGYGLRDDADWTIGPRGKRNYRNIKHAPGAAMHGYAFTTEQHNDATTIEQAQTGTVHDDDSGASMSTHTDSALGQQAGGSGKVVLGALSLAAVLKIAGVW